MPQNPNEIVKILNELAKTLQDMSETELTTVESILLQKKSNKDKEDRLKVAETELEQTKKELALKEENKKKLLDKKVKTNQFLIYNDLAKTILPKDNNRVESKKPLDITTLIKSTIKQTSNKPEIKNVTSTSTNNTDKLITKLDRNDEESYYEIEIKLLKAIDEKISKLKIGTSGNLLDFITSGLPKIIGALTGAGELGAGGLVAGIAAKYFPAFAKLGKAEKVIAPATKASKLFPTFTKIAKGVKNPKVALPMIAAAGVASVGYSLYEDHKDNEESKNVDGRYLGGPTNKDNMYLVGEKGPEIFKPNSNGQIIPNSSLSNNEDVVSTFEDMQKILVKNIAIPVKLMTGHIKSFRDIVDDVIDYVKNLSSNILDSVKGILESKINDVENVPKQGINKVIKTVNSITGAKVDTLPIDRKSSASSVSPSIPNPGNTPQSFYGEYKVPETRVEKIHQGEMIVPAAQSEVIRAASELSNKYSVVNNNSYSTTSQDVDKDFWMKKFVPAFAESIKSKKKARDSSVQNPIADVFGM